MTTCGVCKQTVDFRNGPHVHDPKTCQVCERSLPAAAFAPWRSSGDGRRHQCRDCLKRQRPASPTPEETRERRETRKADRNQRLRTRGYRWVIEAPDGRILTIKQAENEIDDIEYAESRKDWDEVPPGADL